MKTYPHLENGEIIELVRKDEHDAAVDEVYNELTEQLASFRAELTRWQSLAERLATVLTRCDNLLSGEMPFRRHSPIWQVLNGIEIYDSIKPALAAYKSGNLPDPLAEAVKRMEAVPISYSPVTYVDVEAVRALLIQAAKGEQP